LNKNEIPINSAKVIKKCKQTSSPPDYDKKYLQRLEQINVEKMEADE